MKNLIFPILAALVVSCSKHDEKASHIDPAITKLPDTAYVSANKDFLDQYRQIDFDKIKFSATESAEGRKLKEDYAAMLPLHAGNQPVFAVSRFRLDKDNTALITAIKNGKSLQLCVYSRPAEAVTGNIEIAAVSSEPGFYGTTETAMKKDSGKIRGIISYFSEIKPVDASDPTHPYAFRDYYRLSLKNGKIDTAKIPAAKASQFLKSLGK